MKSRSRAEDLTLSRGSGVAHRGPKPVAQRIFQELRSAIVTMRLPPGQALSENDIATRMAVSRQPVREAFIKLSEIGLVRIRPQRGTFVVKISTKQVTDARFVREAVEVAVVRRACESLTADVLAALRENLALERNAAAEEAPAAFLALDEAFHRGLALGIGCEYAWTVVEEVKAQMDRVRYLSMPQATPFARLVDQHTAILDAVEAHDQARAEAAVHHHLSEILTSLPLLERAHPDLFDSGQESEEVSGPLGPISA